MDKLSTLATISQSMVGMEIKRSQRAGEVVAVETTSFSRLDEPKSSAKEAVGDVANDDSEMNSSSAIIKQVTGKKAIARKIGKKNAKNKLSKAKEAKNKKSKKKKEVLRQKKRLGDFLKRHYSTHIETAGTAPRLNIQQMHGEVLTKDIQNGVGMSGPLVPTLPQIISKDRMCSRLRARREFEEAFLDMYPNLERRWPTVGGSPVDFFSLYNMVMKDGGYKNFHRLRKWQKYCKTFRVPPTCTSSGNLLSMQYQKYLLPIENIFVQWCEENNIRWKKAKDDAEDKPLSLKSNDNPISPQEIKQWVQCAKCRKWRIIEDGIDPNALPDDWKCSDNTWAPEYASCSAPEQDYSDEVRVDHGKDISASDRVLVANLPKSVVTMKQIDVKIMGQHLTSSKIVKANVLSTFAETNLRSEEATRVIRVKIRHPNTTVDRNVLKAIVPLSFFSKRSISNTDTRVVRVKVKPPSTGKYYATVGGDQASKCGGGDENSSVVGAMNNSNSNIPSSSSDESPSSSDESSSSSDESPSSSDESSSSSDESLSSSDESPSSSDESSSSSDESSSSSDESSSSNDTDIEEPNLVIGPEFDSKFQNAGAAAANMPARKMIDDEKEYFPEYRDDPSLRVAYLEARNHILFLWLGNVGVRLTLCKVLQGIDPQNVPLVATVYQYLETKGKINYGCFMTESKKEEGPVLSTSNNSFKGKVCIIGAGMAGLITARQLQYFGYDVEIIEARNRIGGRVLTIGKPFKHPVDLGAMITTGICGNPCHILTRQLKLTEYELKVDRTSKLYSGDGGNEIDKSEDEVGDYLFNDLLAHATENRLRYRREEKLDAFEREWKQKHIKSTLTAKTELNVCEGANTDVSNSTTNRNKISLLPSGTGTDQSDALEINDQNREVRYDHSRSGRKRKFIDYSNISSSIDLAIEEAEHTHRLHIAKMEYEEKSKIIAKPNEPTSSPKSAACLSSSTTQKSPSTSKNMAETKPVIRRRKRRKHWTNDDSDVDTDEEDTKVMKTHLQQMCANIEEAGPDVSLGKALEKAYRETIGRTEQKGVPSMKAKNAKFWSASRDLLIEWHRANLEFGCAAELENVSNTYWDQDDLSPTTFKGQHVVIDGGYGQLCSGLAKDLKIRLGLPVKKIRYSNCINDVLGDSDYLSNESTKSNRSDHNAVSIELDNGSSMHYDLIVSTVPLGCMQKGDVEFVPALPKRKSQAIKRMGAGNLNKVVLEFRSCFWNPDDDIFGRVGESGSNRGHAYMFASFVSNQSAVLTAFMAGNAAEEMEKKSDAEVVDGVLEVLRNMYGKEIVTKPISSHVSMWGKDQYARGAYSYVAVGSNGDDYDALKESINKTLYFAGEHCSRSNPTTCAGAMMSGLECAEEIVRDHGRWQYDIITDVYLKQAVEAPKQCLGHRYKKH